MINKFARGKYLSFRKPNSGDSETVAVSRINILCPLHSLINRELATPPQTFRPGALISK